MDDDFDIYEDLPESCNIKDNAGCTEKNEDLAKAQEELKKEISELTSKLESLKKINETLEVNLSSLLKTAKAEIVRKDKIIDELRKQVDNMSFRRGRFNRNIREINSKPTQQMPMSNVEEVNNVQPADENLTNETTSLVETKHNVNQSDQDQDVSDYKRFSNRYHDTKYNSTNSKESVKLSTTIFTKRLRKRIIEEEEAEQKRKLEVKEKENIIEENNHESNKEINIDDKENQSQFSIWNSNVDNMNVGCKGTEHNYAVNSNNVEDNVACMENQQKLTVSVKPSEKRVDHDTDMPTRKRRKLEMEQNGREEDGFSEYDREILLNTKTDKVDYKDNSNAYIERFDSHSNSQYDRENSRSRSRSTDVSYKRKDHYKKFRSDHNYSKEITYCHEKDKYSRSRNRSPIQKYSDIKHKYRDDKYRDHRDRFDRRRNFHDKSEDASITSNKRSYDLRNKDKHRSNGKYNVRDFNSPRHKGSRYPDSRVPRSISHERSKSGSRERTNHKTYDKRSSTSTKSYNCSEEYTTVSLKKKDETDELKEAPTFKKKKDILEEPIKIDDTSTLEDGEIVDTSPIKANINMENRETKSMGENINVDYCNRLENKVTSSKLMDELITGSCTSIKEEKKKIIEDEKNEDDDQTKKVEKTNVNITNNVNISPKLDNPLVESKQDCIVTSTVIITEKDSKCDEQIVYHALDKGTVDTCDNTQKFPKEASDVKETFGEVKHESNTDCTNNIKTEESNASETKSVLSKKNFVSQTLASNDLREVPIVKPLQQKEKDNNENERVKPKECESKKESSERKNPGIVVFARRRKCMQLGDTNASMTIVINANDTKSDADLKNNTENNSKSRACKVPRSYNDVL